MAEISTRLPRALRPFGRGQYRLLAEALVFSLYSAGGWIVPAAWQVVQLGGRPTDLSLVALGNSVGLVLAVLLGGVAADRIPQRRILLACEATRCVAFATAAALALTGAIQVWQLAVIAFVLGAVDGFFYPAYSAWLPSLLPADELLAANGIEGALRPSILNAAGPAVASGLIALASPGLAFLVMAVLQVGAAITLAIMRSTPLRRELVDESRHVLVESLADLREGFSYMLRTRWLFATLMFSILLCLVILGPIEVLIPFAVKDQTGGGAGSFALVLAAFGIGGAIGSLAVASRRLPRRYLTLMIIGWGLGCVPLVVVGLTSQLWVMVVALFVCGFLFEASSVVWGTLLQRRVPPAMLGRVSSLDFFVSLALMPVSMALAGPVGEAIGIAPTFVFAGSVPILLAVGTLVLARLGSDERAHPLDADGPDAAAVTGAAAAAGLEPPVEEPRG